MQIYIHRNNQQFGPYTIDQVREYLASGRLHAEDLAWHEGAPDWVPLSKIPEIASAPPSQPGLPSMPPPATGAAIPPPAAANADQLKLQIRRIASRKMLFGGLWCVGGTAVTLGTYEAAAAGNGHGGYVVAWGAVIFGAIQFVRGLILYLRVR
jgi:hypothetical protein